MPILAIFTSPTFTKENYETLRKEIDWESRPSEGGLFHAAAFDDKGGIHVVDVWSSVETMNAFVNTRLRPAFEKFKFAPPSVEVYPIHNLNVFKGIEPYLMGV